MSGDVLIHCGDMFSLFEGSEEDIYDIDEWFALQNFNAILCTGGNHDLVLEARVKRGLVPFEHAIYLQDSDFLLNGTRFWGAPWTPELRGHAFFQDDGELRTSWGKIPHDTQVLITHTPPADILDRSSRGLDLGCRYLRAAVSHISPTLHCFGHVHASAGREQIGETTFINASSVNSQFRIARAPFEFLI
jgi:hypothetical protein